MTEKKALPPVNFSSFIVSLASSAMISLGEMPEPSSGESRVDLDMARHTIDLLGVLIEKTEGNLDDDEKQLIQTVVYELRLKFMDKERQAAD